MYYSCDKHKYSFSARYNVDEIFRIIIIAFVAVDRLILFLLQRMYSYDLSPYLANRKFFTALEAWNRNLPKNFRTSFMFLYYFLQKIDMKNFMSF